MEEKLKELGEKYSFFSESSEVVSFEGSTECNCGSSCNTCSSGCGDGCGFG